MPSTMTRETLRYLRAEITGLLTTFTRDNQLSLKVGTMRYSSTEVTVPITMAFLDASGVAQTQEVRDLEEQGEAYGLPKGSYGKTFMFKSTLFRVTGLKPSRYKFPVCAVRVKDGKSFKFPTAIICKIQS